jgi:hypothetical protein
VLPGDLCVVVNSSTLPFVGFRWKLNGKTQQLVTKELVLIINTEPVPDFIPRGNGGLFDQPVMALFADGQLGWTRRCFLRFVEDDA